MKRFSRLTAIVVVLLGCGAGSAGDWPGFRGPDGCAVSDDKDLPVQWTKDHILWKIKLPGLGSSSPITSGDKVFVTCYAGYGTTLSKGMGGFGKGGFGKGKGGFGKGKADTGDQKNLRLQVLCFDRNGQMLWEREVEPKLPEAPFSDFVSEHGYASSTPVTDGECVYVFFGKTGVVAFDLAGKQLWQADVGSKTHKWGSAASPVLHKNLVIVNAAIESGALLALDKHTGKEVWRAKGMGTCWSSPLLVATKDAGHELVMNLAGRIVGYDPDTGDELWRCDGIGSSTGFGYSCSTPVAKDGVVYAIGGGPGSAPTAMAVRAGGRGDVTNTHVLWRQNAGTSISSPVVSGDHLYWVAGTAHCLRTDTGKVVYRERLYDARGEYVSAVAAGDKIFALTRFDGVHVFTAGDKFAKLAHNEFEGDTSIFNASPALSKGRLYIRSNAYLYCIGKRS